METYKSSPILVRIQKKNESISQSAEYLLKAMKIKKSKKSILIQTQKNDLFDEKIDINGIIVLNSPALSILENMN